MPVVVALAVGEQLATRLRSSWTFRSVVSTTTSASALHRLEQPTARARSASASARRCRAGGGAWCSRSGARARRSTRRGRPPAPGPRPAAERRRGPGRMSSGCGARARGPGPPGRWSSSGDGGQLGDLRDQRRRQVVDHEPAAVLEHVGHRGAPGAREPGDAPRTPSSRPQRVPVGPVTSRGTARERSMTIRRWPERPPQAGGDADPGVDDDDPQTSGSPGSSR